MVFIYDIGIVDGGNGCRRDAIGDINIGDIEALRDNGDGVGNSVGYGKIKRMV